MSIVNKKTSHSGSISLSDAEIAKIAAGTITGFCLDTPWGSNIQVLVQDMSTPIRIPLKDSQGDFKGMSPYWVSSFSPPPGTHTKGKCKTKIYSKEEIAALYK